MTPEAGAADTVHRRPSVHGKSSDRGRDKLQRLTAVDAAALPKLLTRGAQGQPARALLVNVWSTWCMPCIRELPMLIRLEERFRKQGFELILISADAEDEIQVALEHLQEIGAPVPSFVRTGDEEAFIAAFHSSWSGSLPATLLVDQKGRIRQFWGAALDEKMLAPAIIAVLQVHQKQGNPRE